MIKTMAIGLSAVFVAATGAAAQDHYVPVNGRTQAAVSQGEFEHFMRCYGHIAASLDLLDRIGPMVSDPAQIYGLRHQGIMLMNEIFAAPYEQLVDGASGLDLFDGERARQQGREPFDTVAGTGLDVQYERFRQQGAVPQDCLNVAARLAQATGSGQ